LNSFLREQVDRKEQSVRESEEKLRRQDEAIRKAYHDLEHQHQKIKKRETIISRALKRLEKINNLKGLSSNLFDEAENPMLVHQGPKDQHDEDLESMQF